MSYDTVASNTGHVVSVCHLTLQCHPQCNLGPSALYRCVKIEGYYKFKTPLVLARVRI